MHPPFFALNIAFLFNAYRLLGREMVEEMLLDSFRWIVFVIAFILIYVLSKLLEHLIPNK